MSQAAPFKLGKFLGHVTVFLTFGLVIGLSVGVGVTSYRWVVGVTCEAK